MVFDLDAIDQDDGVVDDDSGECDDTEEGDEPHVGTGDDESDDDPDQAEGNRKKNAQGSAKRIDPREGAR